MKNKFPILLFVGYLALFTYCAVAPFDRATWWAENIPIVIIAATLAGLYLQGTRFSNTSYFLMFILLYLHTIGGYYTFERVPFGGSLFGADRNNYDRIAHFTVGFYAFGLAEWLDRNKIIQQKFVFYLFPVFAIAFVAMSYELIEWQYAVQYGGESAENFLGSQGDPWDAQKDMLADTLGAISVMILYSVSRKGIRYASKT